MADTNDITNEVTLQMFGDPVLQERIIFMLSEGLHLQCNETRCTTYTTKRGKHGTHKNVVCKVN